MIPFVGNEVFAVQKALYKNLSGFFGFSKKKVSFIAKSIDAAVIFGAIMQRKGMGSFAELSDEQLLEMLQVRMSELGCLPN